MRSGNMAINKQKQKQYSIQDLNYVQFFLDKRLTSSQRSEIQKGLQQLESFIKLLFSIKIIDRNQGKIIELSKLQQNKIRVQIIRSVIRRLLDLFLNLKIIGLKKLVGKILIEYSDFMKEIAVKDEIVNVISRGIKGMDQFTRVIASRIVGSYTSIFQKDITVFETLLERLKQVNKLNKDKKSGGLFEIVSSEIVELKYFQQCLKRMLASSIPLSEIFLKDIQVAPSGKISTNNQNLDFLFIKHIRIDKFYEYCINSKFQPNQTLKIYNFLLNTHQIRQNQIKMGYNQINEKLKRYLVKIYQDNKYVFQRKHYQRPLPHNENNLCNKYPIVSKEIFFTSINKFNSQQKLNKTQYRFLKILQNISSNQQQFSPQKFTELPILQKMQHKRRNILVLKQFCVLYGLDFLLDLIRIWEMICEILIQQLGQVEHKQKVNSNIKELVQIMKTMFIDLYSGRKQKSRSISNQGAQKKIQKQMKSLKKQKSNRKIYLIQKQLELLKEIFSFFKNSWNQDQNSTWILTMSEASLASNALIQFIKQMAKFQWARISNKLIVGEIFPSLMEFKKR